MWDWVGNIPPSASLGVLRLGESHCGTQTFGALQLLATQTVFKDHHHHHYHHHQHHHVEACQECRNSGLTPDLWNLNLHLNNHSLVINNHIRV